MQCMCVCAPLEMSEMTEDVKSRLWCTYRKNFKAISEYMNRECRGKEGEDDSVVVSSPAGGTNITCDQGWGCTLRCGQMIMGNTLLHKHLGRG